MDEKNIGFPDAAIAEAKIRAEREAMYTGQTTSTCRPSAEIRAEEEAKRKAAEETKTQETAKNESQALTEEPQAESKAEPPVLAGSAPAAEASASEEAHKEEVRAQETNPNESISNPELMTGPDDNDIREDEPEDDGSMSLVEHLTELRTRIIRSLIAIALCSCVTYFFLDDITKWLTAPAGKLYFMKPHEAFFTYVKIVIFSGFLLAVPLVFYQIWRFFLPALTAKERLVLGLVVPSSVILFYAGMAFSFFLVLPVGIKFFMGLGTDSLSALWSIEEYLDFCITFILPSGIVFELPLAIVILAKMGLVTSEFIKKQFRIVILLAFIIGAILTPPDVFSQAMIALPMIALYGLSYGIVKYIMRK